MSKPKKDRAVSTRLLEQSERISALEHERDEALGRLGEISDAVGLGQGRDSKDLVSLVRHEVELAHANATLAAEVTSIRDALAVRVAELERENAGLAQERMLRETAEGMLGLVARALNGEAISSEVRTCPEVDSALRLWREWNRLDSRGAALEHDLEGERYFRQQSRQRVAELERKLNEAQEKADQFGAQAALHGADLNNASARVAELEVALATARHQALEATLARLPPDDADRERSTRAVLAEICALFPYRVEWAHLVDTVRELRAVRDLALDQVRLIREERDEALRRANRSAAPPVKAPPPADEEDEFCAAIASASVHLPPRAITGPAVRSVRPEVDLGGDDVEPPPADATAIRNAALGEALAAVDALKEPHNGQRDAVEAISALASSPLPCGAPDVRDARIVELRTLLERCAAVVRGLDGCVLWEDSQEWHLFSRERTTRALAAVHDLAAVLRAAGVAFTAAASERAQGEATLTLTPAEVMHSGKRLHRLKTHPEPFDGLRDLSKPYEIRQMDRDFRVGDILKLEEWDPATSKYTSRWLLRRVTRIDGPGKWRLPADVCVMGLAPLEFNRFADGVADGAAADDGTKFCSTCSGRGRISENEQCGACAGTGGPADEAAPPPAQPAEEATIHAGPDAARWLATPAETLLKEQEARTCATCRRSPDDLLAGSLCERVTDPDAPVPSPCRYWSPKSGGEKAL